METKKKPKARIFTVFYAVFVLFMLAIIVTVAVIGLRQTTSSTYYINEMNAGTEVLHTAHVYFEKTRTLSNELIVYAQDSERAEQADYLLRDYLDSMESLLNHYNQYITNAQEMELSQELSYLTTIQYRDFCERMRSLRYSGEVEAMQALLLENEPIANEISVVFELLFNMNHSILYENVWQIENVTNTIIITLIIVAVVAFILIIIASVVLVIITNPAELREKETGYEYRYKSDYTQADGLTQTELQQCLADLRAVTNELSQALKERQ